MALSTLLGLGMHLQDVQTAMQLMSLVKTYHQYFFPQESVTPRVLAVVKTNHDIHLHESILGRQTLKKTALELNLGGYCKYGWPGIVIVEGLESDVQEYVQIISSLRWQSIQVKYHKTKRLSSLLKGDRTISVDDHIDDNRVFHKDFLEVDDMKILARICEDAGQKSLFDSFIKSGCVHKEV